MFINTAIHKKRYDVIFFVNARSAWNNGTHTNQQGTDVVKEHSGRAAMAEQGRQVRSGWSGARRASDKNLTAHRVRSCHRMHGVAKSGRPCSYGGHAGDRQAGIQYRQADIQYREAELHERLQGELRCGIGTAKPGTYGQM